MKLFKHLVTWLGAYLNVAEGRSDHAETSQAALETAFKGRPPLIEPPPSLHASIMSAVRASQPETTSRWTFGLTWRFAIPATMGLALAGFWYLSKVTETDSLIEDSFTPASAALRVGRTFARDIPSDVVTPLTEELERLDQDLDSAREVILASLP